YLTGNRACWQSGGAGNGISFFPFAKHDKMGGGRLWMVKRVVDDVKELIGWTPMIRIKRFALPEGVSLFAKLEYFNPGGSVKDRIGLAFIREAEKSGKLKPGGTTIEPTAGNTGIGLALAAVGTGYRVIFVVPEKFSE